MTKNPKMKLILNSIIVILTIFFIYLLFFKPSHTLPYGTFSGTLPCADCSGIKTTLKLNQDFTYFLDQEYIGKNTEVFTEVGKWTPSEDFTFIELGYDKPNNIYYKIVNKDTLEKLDENAQIIKSDMNYKLIRE